MRSVMTHQFSQVPKAEIQRSSFDRSHGYKTTFDAGQLIPIFCDEVLPGDTFNLKMTGFARMATPIYPIMDNIFMDTFFFFVPYRLVWDNWQKFMGEQANPTDSTDFTIPLCTGSWAEGSLGDYLGLPTGLAALSVSALPLRAYNLIWNEWFRDQNLQDSITIATGDAASVPSAYQIKRRGKRHDYFTSCLPWPQKGDAVSLPLAGNAPVLTSATDQITGAQAGLRIKTASSGGNMTSGEPALTAATTAPNVGIRTTPGGTYVNTPWYPSNLYADLAAVSSATINDLRESFQVQRLLERDARGGTRYTEIIRSHFGVTSPDARLQRPEYLGGGSSPVNVNPVAQTQRTDAGATPQGTLAAYATSTLHNHGFTHSFTEHGVIIGLIAVRADLTYQQGLERAWSRQTRYDFYWPALAHLGEQAVLNQEIFTQGTAADTQVFGYQERYAEYRYKPSRITGLFRSSAAQSLDAWHLSQDFSALPTLNATFIEDNPPLDRVIAVPAEPHFLFDSYFKLRCARPMPLYGVPGLIDHF